MLYNNCRELPIHNFFEINRSNDFSYLVKSGKKPSDEVLQEKFLDIIDEYNSLFTTKNKNVAIVNRTQIMTLELKLMNLRILEILIENKGITAEIRETAKKMRVNCEDISTHVSAITNDLKRLEAEIENEPESTEKNDNSLEKSLTLVKENGFNFDRFTTPIIEFVFAINRLEEKNKPKK